jgi:hypothetical protein
MRDPDKIIKVEYGDRTFFALIMFALTIFICIIIYFETANNRSLIYDQQEQIKTKDELITKYVTQINEMHGTVSFVVGRLAEQANLIRHKCTVLADLLQSELEQQQQMFQQLMIPSHEVKE